MPDETTPDDYCWLTSNSKGRGQPPPSPLGLAVGRIMAATFRGIYNMPRVYKVDWANPRIITARFARNLATFDGSELTTLVVLCHDAAIRLEIDLGRMREYHEDRQESYTLPCLKLMFTQRIRVGSIYDRHPTIEEAISQIRGNGDSR